MPWVGMGGRLYDIRHDCLAAATASDSPPPVLPPPAFLPVVIAPFVRVLTSAVRLAAPLAAFAHDPRLLIGFLLLFADVISRSCFVPCVIVVVIPVIIVYLCLIGSRE